MDQPRIERLLRLMKMLSSNVNYTVEELANKFDVSIRTMYRYIDTLKTSGFELTRYPGNVYKIGKMPKSAPDFEKLLYFSEEEAYILNKLIDRLDQSNTLKANLKSKLAAVYDHVDIADFVDRKFTAAFVDELGKAVRTKKKVILHNYESGNSHSIRDRLIEPFGFTRDFVDVWGYDLEDGHNKIFKISRIDDVEILDESWTAEKSHRKQGIDIFRMVGKNPVHIKWRISVLAKNLLIEEYPLAEKYLTCKGRDWLLETDVYNMLGACRFYLGLASEIKIVESEEFRAFVQNYIDANLRRI